ncbi:type II toxin-antitoxin system RelE/ParE family toxin [Companilactobacillus mishanensis]|uniref:Type II toxin-antitoxin system RelE/ParE family toxin n=1 Tax=Companilactobacillus mishanensis TaxID=2486008 RepID=A0ABW9P7L9_9LACO|nr:type II toxin-antitoxin system RelE/ParE family toxin [Companilactobacillus mishanensis]MQS45209.1 type II toxin-antitoxin system RelE/ParE family toxin [Companilactobacillus mishanensis]
MKNIKFEYFDFEQFEIFLNTFTVKDSAKLMETISKIEKNGFVISMKQKLIKQIDSNLFEIRSNRGSYKKQIIYFHRIGNEYIIVKSFSKKFLMLSQRRVGFAAEIEKILGDK